jgi:hypothetical protein
MVARLLAAALLVAALGACEAITGHPRCDERVAYPVLDIIQAGATVNCRPNFSSTDQHGVRHNAWWDPARQTVWAWPDQMSDRMLYKTLFHESGHVHGARSEWAADAYAYCHMDAGQRAGIGFLAPTPRC